MIAENKAEFFEELERELQRLGVEDTSELIADLEEHFAEGERRGLGEDEVCRELGSIKEIARSCLDIKSSAINSMAAHEVSRRKAVSLTKPGRDVPADPSLAKPKEDAVRSFTPEHIAEEIVPDGADPERDLQSESGGSSQSNDPQSSTTEGSQENNSQGSGTQSNSSQNTTAGNSQNTDAEGVFERLGKKVDAACDKAGQALNGAFGKAEGALDKAGSKVNEALKKTPLFSPSDSYRRSINGSKRGDIPNQSVKVKTKDAAKFVDFSQLTPNIRPGRLVFEIILDVLLWIWLVPVVIVGVLALFVASAWIVWIGIRSLLGLGSTFGMFFFPTRILFALGFVALASAAACLASVLVKPAFALPGYVIRRHMRAVYDV